MRVLPRFKRRVRKTGRALNRFVGKRMIVHKSPSHSEFKRRQSSHHTFGLGVRGFILTPIPLFQK
jgi:hypothetical protein